MLHLAVLLQLGLACAFHVFDNTAYTNTSIGYGTTNINWIPNYVCKPLVANGALPDAAVWKAIVQQWAVYPTYPLVLDCEDLYLNDGSTVADHLARLSALQTWAADVLPEGSLIGWYGIAGNTPAAYYSYYRRLIANHSNTAFFPSAYTFTSSFATWEASLSSVLAQTQAIDPTLPVVPYTWPQYHGNYSFFPVSLWQQELEHLASTDGVDGFIIWGGKNHAVCDDACQATAGQQPWLGVTRTFLSTLYGIYNGVPLKSGGQLFDRL
ncbi:hypothetical protein DV735_g4233, partial [Chaetothyriales sp. CBS 134920]